MAGEWKIYIGVEKVHACPEDRNGKPGYAVIHADGYDNWRPKDFFEATYMQIDRPSRLTTIDIERLVETSEIDVSTVGRTTVVRITLPMAYTLVETCTCSDSDHYSEDLGAGACLGKIKCRLWDLLGFTLQWAHHGLKK